MTPAWFGFALAAMTAAPQDSAGEQTAWLGEHAFAFDTVEAGRGLEDLEPLRALVGDARIVSLGESTHGSREIFQMKHRLLEFLATEMGFTVFGIEASMPESYAVGDYVRNGEGDAHALVEGMYFWTWHTEEVLAMVEWMRDFNASGDGELAFTGFDMQTPDVALALVRAFLQAADPEYAPRAAELYEGVTRAQGSASDFGVATATLSSERARGRTLLFSGDVKTDLESGYAGLWMRVDGPAGLIFLDTMDGRGPTGTSDWERYEIAVDVPEEASNIVFGAIVPGKGVAWFDDFMIEFDDGPLELGADLDLDFEGPTPSGFYAASQGYRTTTSSAQRTRGERSLEIASRDTGLSADAAAERCAEVLAHMQARRDAYLETRFPEEVEWAIQCARVVRQCLQTRARDRTQSRDRSMADNVAWILEQDHDARIVVWAHNGHVARRPGWMGRFLDERFGAEQLVVGFATSHGQYYAVGQGGSGQGAFELQEPPAKSFEALLEAVDEPRLIVDLRPAEAGSPESGWLHEPMPFRSVGALEMDQQFSPAPLAREFDLIVYLRDTTAARQLPWKTR